MLLPGMLHFRVVYMTCRAYDGSIMMGILPVATFCSGHTFFVQGMADVLGLEPYVVHATFQFSGTPGKRHRMREALLWDVVSLSYVTVEGMQHALWVMQSLQGMLVRYLAHVACFKPSCCVAYKPAST